MHHSLVISDRNNVPSITSHYICGDVALHNNMCCDVASLHTACVVMLHHFTLHVL